MRRLNVMQLTDITGRGGAEKALVDLALRLDRERFSVSVCATRSAGNYQPVLDAAGVPTFIQGRSKRWDPGQWASLVRLLRARKVDILHTHLFGSNNLGRLLGKVAGVPVVIAHEHWSTIPARHAQIDHLLYRLSDRILVPSEASKRMVMEIERIPARYLSVVYNGVDTSTFAPGRDANCTRQQLGVAGDTLLAGTVGRLTPEKGGVDLLIRAVQRLSREGFPARLLIVGDGELRPELERVAGPETIFAGTRNDVQHLLPAMDIFVLPSLKEALPIALLEAMAVRLPVIATRVGGVPEVLEDGVTGLMVPPGDQDALYCALHRLATQPELRASLAAQAHDHIHSHFTIDKMVRRVERLYERLATRMGIGR